MSKYLFLLLLLLGITAAANAQEMMLNGSFEDYDGNPDGDPDPSTVSYAAYWRNLLGTCDLVHPDVTVDMSGIPCFGVGAGRFGVPPSSGAAEYFYGRTLPLTAGQIYEVSFWFRKDNVTEVNKSIGMVMTETVPTSSIVSATPLILVTPESTQCKKAKICFTAEHSVTHYLTFGPYNGFGSGESMVYLIDSVSVLTIPPTTALATANLSVSQPVICAGGQVTLDGTASANETSYEWKIYHTSTGGAQIYSSGVLQGTAGTFTPLLPFAVPGSCYRAELTVYGVCKDVSSVEFCIADPNIDFIFDGNPVCENLPVDLQVTGDNGWTYTWSDGTGQLASGTGLKNLTVTPSIGNGTYSVTVTTQEGCTHTETVTLNVNSQNNLAPWMDGINGTGEYTYYARQGDPVFFTSMLSNDHSNEIIIYNVVSNTIPSSHSVTPPGQYGGVLTFSWAIPLSTPVGEYHYKLKANDQNACGLGIDTFDFRIIVVCDHCPVCVSYENRTPGNNPLPPETKSGKCIKAGLTDFVSTGDEPVLFQAGVSIETENFYAGPGYQGIIEPTTCLTDCEDCCNDWSGFRYDNAYYHYINKVDNDPTNDYFEITDMDHPFCSYGARRFSLYILDSDNQQEYYHLEGGGYQCCMLQTRTPENPIPHSSIFWDGYYGGHPAAYQYYNVVLKLYDCNDIPHEFYFSINVTFLTNQIPQNPNSMGQVGTQILNNATEETNLGSDSTEIVNENLGIFPNPATNMLYISGSRTETTTIQLYDEKGRVLTKREKVALNQGYSLESFSSGTYYCRIYKEDGTYVLKQFIKL